MKARIFGPVAFFLVTALIVIAQPARAQSGTEIKGSVTDERGDKITGAEVRLSSLDGIQFQTTTDRGGAFAFSDLRSGSYLVEAKADGFAPASSAEFALKRGESKEVQLQLKLAAINASVVVTATGTPQRADEVAKVLTILDSQQIEVKHEVGSYLAPVFENNFPFRQAELKFSGYTKVDLFASFEKRLSERITAVMFGGADNLFDQKYFENGFRAPGIVGRGGVNFKF